jgi:hypothetical protein
VTNTGDLLSAASILLGIITFLYGLWHTELDEAEEIQVPRHLEDAAPQRRKVRAARRKAFFVAAAASVFVLVFAPEVIGALDDMVDDYDAVEVSLLVVWVGLIWLAWHSGRTAWRLHRHHRRLTP